MSQNIFFNILNTKNEKEILDYTKTNLVDVSSTLDKSEFN